MSKDERTRSRGQKARPTIAYLAPAIHGGSVDQWTGVVDAAQKYNVNLICFPGYSLRDRRTFFAQANIIYDLANAENLDGVISWASSIGNYTDADDLDAFHARYRSLPMVSIGQVLEGVPSLLMDSYSGMREAIVHLIEDHGYRHLAFIRGPEGHFYAQERYRAYVETLEAYDIPFDSKLVTLPGAWGAVTGREAARLLFEERKLRPGVDIEAAIGANDHLILAVLEVMQARGLQIPGDVAIVGFDDRLEGRTSMPPLTSVAAPFYDTGYRAVETLLALMAGEQIPEEVLVPSRLVVRRSCGCLDPAVIQAAASTNAVAGPAKRKKETLETILVAQREEILAQVVQAVEALGGSLDPAWAGRLLDGFVAELGEAPTGAFLAALNRVLRQVTVTAGNIASGHIAAMQNAVSALRRATLPYLDSEKRSQAEDLWQQARVAIAVEVERARAREAQEAETQAQAVRDIGLALTTASNMGELMDMLTERLPQLEIPSAYLALYESPQPYRYPQPVSAWSRLVLAHTAAAPDSKKDGLPPDGLRFPSRELVPQGMWPDGRYSYVAEPLYFREEQMGFALFEIERQRDSDIYNELRAEISSALQGVLLRDQVERRAVQVQTAAEVSRAASSILTPETLIERMVALVCERFDLYYVGLFMVDRTGEWTGEAGKWAVLRAGTGEAGQQMMAQGHKLAVDGESMIGACVADGEARIALDVGAEAVRFENPLLPDTRSELALPLVSQSEIIGALTIQSAQVTAFKKEDIAVFQTMADQLANAIQNARLVNQLEAALQETEITQRRYIQQAWSEYPAVRAIFDYERPGTEGETMKAKAQRAIAERRTVVESRDGVTGQPTLVVPVILRDQPIGMLGFEAERGREWSDADVALAESLAEQLGLAAENLRLLDETQRRAAREQLAGQVTARMRESLDVETVLKTAVNEIQQALGLERVAIRLMTESNELQRGTIEEE